MDDLDLLVSLHLDGARQGPGGAAETRLAVELAGLARGEPLQIADLGCGSGAATLDLAAALPAAQLTAVDFLPAFLERLEARAAQAGVSKRVTTLAASMDQLPFAAASLDAIWSEGAIYNIGFEAGLRYWRQFLKPGGVLAVSELTWLTGARPAELEAHWQAAYAGVATASAKIAQLEASGYMLLGYFPLPERCWLDNYYRPLEARFDEFLARHGRSIAAQALVAAERQEISLYERFSAHVGYGFYIARSLGSE